MENFTPTIIEETSYLNGLFLRVVGFGSLTLALLFGAWTVSAFNYGLFVTTETDAASLVAPVPITAEAPKPPESEQRQQPQRSRNQQTTISRDRVASIEQSLNRVPSKVDTTSNNVKTIPKGVTGKIAQTDNFPVQGGERTGDGQSSVVAQKPAPVEEATPPPMKTPTPVPEKTPVRILKQSTGATMGRLISIVKPVVPETVKFLLPTRPSVLVEIDINEDGVVTSIKSVTGHTNPILRAISKQAALTAKFRPTLLSGVPVKTIGTIAFNFN